MVKMCKNNTNYHLYCEKVTKIANKDFAQGIAFRYFMHIFATESPRLHTVRSARGAF